VLPALKERGVTDEQITQMLVDNPKKVFERQGAY
jgi:phosphotriesterase-related protein